MNVPSRLMTHLSGLLLASVLVFSAAACGGGDGDEPAPAPGAGQPTVAPAPGDEQPAPTPGDEQEDGEAGADAESYFQRLEDLFSAASEESDALIEKYPEYFGDRELSQAYFQEVSLLFGELVDDVKSLDPPPEAADAHRDLVTALEDLQAVFPQLVAQLTELESDAGLDDFYNVFFSDEEYVDATERYERACNDLQGIADGNAIDVDLACEQ
jgi:hypothetical protein